MKTASRCSSRKAACVEKGGGSGASLASKHGCFLLRISRESLVGAETREGVVIWSNINNYHVDLAREDESQDLFCR